MYLLKVVGFKNAGYFSAVDWNDITGKPTIPTVDYPVTDVQVNNVSVVTNKVAKLTAGTQYVHNINLKSSDKAFYATAQIINQNSTAFTIDSLKQ
jgi:hypothetical protein